MFNIYNRPYALYHNLCSFCGIKLTLLYLFIIAWQAVSTQQLDAIYSKKVKDILLFVAPNIFELTNYNLSVCLVTAYCKRPFNIQ